MTALAVFLFMVSLPFIVALSFYGFFRIWGKIIWKHLLQFFAIISFALLPSSCFNLHVYFRLFCQTTFVEMPSLIRKEKNTFENCSTQTTKLNLARHIKRCSAGTLYCDPMSQFLQKITKWSELPYWWEAQRPKPDVIFKCKLCYQEVPGFNALRQHRNTQHGMPFGSGTKDVDVEHIVGNVEDRMLREELRSCQHFSVDSELERERHKVFNYAVESLNETILNEKLDNFLTNWNVQQKWIWFLVSLWKI